jgi:ABC-type nitrate/sulfonate/bicarbonate transport system substrate-binding protein/outer membrane protein OmpA-like peptidoglycan-associated protein
MTGLIRFSVVLFAIFLWINPAAAAPRYVQSPALSKVAAGVKVGAVSNKTPVQLPIITWGGDIATILANGSSAITAAGSLFADQGLQFKLVREDVFPKQVQAYLEGKSPYLRGTMGMINMAAEVVSRDPHTKPVVIYQMTWSTGGDALVVKPGIHAVKDLRGKTIALQAYGPHVDYMTKILAGGGLTPGDVNIRWLPDLTGTDNSPMAALQQNDVDAAFVIIPDAMLLTSGGAVGTGAEDSIKGAKILLSTRTANRIIADVYAVRSDYLQQHKAEVEKFVHTLLLAREELKNLVQNKQANKNTYQQLLRQSAQILLDTAQATADVEGLYGDCEFVGWQGNVDFFANPAAARSMENLVKEIQPPFIQLGLLASRVALDKAGWNYEQLRSGLQQTRGGQSQRFNQEQVAELVAHRQQTGAMDSGELFKFEIFFKPNQNTFSADLYQQAFDKVIDYATTYGGALVTIEGHSDPLGYLRKKKKGEQELVLGRIKQSAKNLSLSRAIAVRDSVINFANRKNVSLDPSQFAVVGHGIANPKSGICGADPCAPKTEKEWRDNMRVEFRIIQVEAEAEVFNPL